MSIVLVESSSNQQLKSTHVTNGKIILVIVLLTSLAEMSFNAFFIGAAEIGLTSAMVFLSSIGIVCGLVLYADDPWLLRFAKGVFTILILMTVSGVFLLYVNQFSLLASMAIALLWSVFFLVLYLRKEVASKRPISEEIREPRSLLKWFVAGLFVIVLVALFFILFNSRTTEPMFDIWSNIPNEPFLFLLFSCSLTIVFLIMFRKGNCVQLLMILGISILIEGIYYLAWYPSLYGDPFITLGHARYVYTTGTLYEWENLFSNRLLIDIIKGRGFPVFTAQLTRMLDFDIYWVHNIVVSFLWSVIIPVSLYEITCLLTGKKTNAYPRQALFSAFAGTLLVPVLVVWGSNPTGNTLGFLFLFFSVPLTLRWALQGGRLYWSLAFVVSLASFMTHPMPGIFGFVFLFGALVFREATSTYEKIGAFIALALVLPVVLIFAGSEFLPPSLTSVQNVLDFENAALTFSMLLSFAGLFLSLKFKILNRQILSLLVGFYVIVVADFYISQYWLTAVAYGAERALVVAEFLFTPFIGLLFATLPRLFETDKSVMHGHNPVSKSPRWRSITPKAGVVSLLVLLVSLQSVVSIYQAFPHNEVGIAPAEYEMEAIYYIVSTSTRRFVVVSDTLFSNLAVGLLGVDWSAIGENQRGSFGTSSWDFPLQQDFLKMLNQPSLTVLDEARAFAASDEAFFVISKRNPKFNEVVNMTLEILPVDKIFGDGKLYVFKHPVPLTEGSGPNVKVAYDYGTAMEEVGSKFIYSIRKDVSYSIDVSGHSAYNVSDYPLYWVFKTLTVNNLAKTFDESSDVNSFIFMDGLDPADVVKITWGANDEYPLCGWKEDSFKQGWGPYPAYTYKIDPEIRAANGILSLSGNFTAGTTLDVQEDFYYARPANVSTDEFPYLIIRWRSSDNVAVSYVYYEGWSNQEVIRFGSFSDRWVTTRVKLEPGKQIVYVMIGLSDLGGGADIQGRQTLYVDYILLCNSSP